MYTTTVRIQVIVLVRIATNEWWESSTNSGSTSTRNHLSWPAKVPQGGAPQQLKQPLVVPFKLLWEIWWLAILLGLSRFMIRRVSSWGFESTFSTSLWIRGVYDASLKFEQPDCFRQTSGQNPILWGPDALAPNQTSHIIPKSSSTYCPACCQKEIIFDMVNGTLTAAKGVLCYMILNISSSAQC